MEDYGGRESRPVPPPLDFLKTKLKKYRNLPNINTKAKLPLLTGRGGP
jgi:hypothetical protein